MQWMISHAKEWVWNGKNLAKNSTQIFGNGTVFGWNGTVADNDSTVVGGTGDE